MSKDNLTAVLYGIEDLRLEQRPIPEIKDHEVLLQMDRVFRYCNDYPAALALVSSGEVDVKKLITHHFDITETAEAFNTARYGLGNAIKVMIHCTPRNSNNPIPL